MAIFCRVVIAAGLLWLGAALNGGAVAQEGSIPQHILLAIAEAGEVAHRAEARASTPEFERRAVATRLSAQTVSAIASYPRDARTILRTAMSASPRHRIYIAEKVTAAFPGYKNLAWSEANAAPNRPRLVRAAATETATVARVEQPAAMKSPARDRDFGLTAVILGFGGHDVGAFGHRKESGADLNAEIRFTPFGGWLWDFILSPEPHIGVHYNTDGNTNQVFMGGTWMYDLGWGFFGGGSLSLSLHDGETDTEKLDRKELGLPVLFRESVELGYRYGDHHGISLHLDHISNASIDENNEGLDTFGLRYIYRL
ncbi:MAG: acyloxyacyl hydrolase [Rhodospirillaceae bacterium]|nr:acyloxyacyl hydrolase [Rhodospirillaceae bacterium]